MKTSNQTTAPETSAQASGSVEPKKKSVPEPAKPLTKSGLSDETEKMLRSVVGQKEMGDAAVAFVRTEVLSLLKRKITPTFVLKVSAKRHRQIAAEIEEALDAAKQKAEEARQATKEMKATTNASTNESSATTVPAA